MQLVQRYRANAPEKTTQTNKRERIVMSIILRIALHMHAYGDSPLGSAPASTRWPVGSTSSTDASRGNMGMAGYNRSTSFTTCSRYGSFFKSSYVGGSVPAATHTLYILFLLPSSRHIQVLRSMIFRTSSVNVQHARVVVGCGAAPPVLYNPGGSVVSSIRETVPTNASTFYLGVPSCRALAPHHRRHAAQR